MRRAALILTMLASLALVAQSEARPHHAQGGSHGGVQLPGTPHAINRNGHLTQADIDYFKHWSAEGDKADEKLREAVEAGQRACRVVRSYPQGRAAFKRAMGGLAGNATALGSFWGILEKQAGRLKARSTSYSEPLSSFLVEGADVLENLYSARREGDQLGLRYAAEHLGLLECSVSGKISFYQRERHHEQAGLPDAIGFLESVLAHSS